MSVYYEGVQGNTVIYISLHRNPELSNTVKSDITFVVACKRNLGKTVTVRIDRNLNQEFSSDGNL